MKVNNFILYIFLIGFPLSFFCQTFQPFEKDGKYGVKDSKGKQIIPANYAAIGEIFRSEIIPVKNVSGKWGFFKNDELLFECQFDNFRFTSVGTLIAQKNSYWGIFSMDGRILAPCRYKYINHLDAHVYKAGRYNQWKLRTFKNEIVESYELDSVFYMGDNIFKFCQIGNYGLMDPKGKIITTENTDLFLSMQPVKFETKKKEETATINTTFKPKKLRYQKIYKFKEGFARYMVDGKYGFIDSLENIRLVPQYDDARDFSNNMAAIKLLGKWGFMDTLERLKVQPYYDEVSDFKNGVALVREGNHYNFVNKEGRFIYESPFELIQRTPYGRYVLKKNGKYGLADAYGKEMVSTKYEKIEELENRFILAKEHGLWGVLNPEGNQVIAFNYSVAQYEWDHHYVLTMEPGGEIKLEVK
jgi:hypothetical protein